ncbi:MAG: VWA domain-containing protein [Deltaproteobacteria bacterium]|nr:VWA domain-containing protein [Deltaproteobacteria bacterium]
MKRDLRSLAPDEETRLHAVLQLLLAKLFTRPGRRYRTGSRGRTIEFRGTFRKSVRSQGEFLTLVRREPKLVRRRIALLGDVSGSMDVYSRFFLRLSQGIARLEPHTEVYAFSTRLFRLTETVRSRDFAFALERLSAQTVGWSGGTRIGDCLKEFNDALGRESHLRQVVAVIFSDGWDRGDAATLRREMVRLKGSAARVYWLNPLKGDPDYRPLCRGMSTALPYLDGFFAAHNAESLARFARRLARVR